MVNQILLENKILNISEFEKPKEKEQDFVLIIYDLLNSLKNLILNWLMNNFLMKT